MSATDELRRLLNERGVEYEGGKRSVRWRDRNGVMMQAFPLADGELGMEVWSCTPEQAIAATLGSCNCSNSERTDGTCHAIVSDNLTESEGTGDAWADCSECGHLLFVLTDPNSEPPNFCPNCGRKVVDA